MVIKLFDVADMTLLIPVYVVQTRLKNLLIKCRCSQISVSADSRNTAWVSFDGRRRQELKHGER